MKDIIIGIFLSAVALGSAYIIYQQVKPMPGYQVGFCKSLYNGNTDKIENCLDQYDDMNNVTGIYDENGKPVQ
jgi:hypothetical protein